MIVKRSRGGAIEQLSTRLPLGELRELPREPNQRQKRTLQRCVCHAFEHTDAHKYTQMQIDRHTHIHKNHYYYCTYYMIINNLVQLIIYFPLIKVCDF